MIDWINRGNTPDEKIIQGTFVKTALQKKESEGRPILGL